MSKVFVGTSGWQYPHWQPKFYPQNLPQKEWLVFYAKSFETIEVNATFYHQMKPQTFEKWRKIVRPDFVFSIKGSRFISHIKRLKDCQEELERFFESADFLRGETSKEVPPPKEKNVVLWQLPPNFQANQERLESFLKILPRLTWRHAFEFRHETWVEENTWETLKKYNVAAVFQDWRGWPQIREITADFVYVRFHGNKILYTSPYTNAELDEWVLKMKQWLKQGLDVYAYFNNDAMGYAIENAKTLKEKLK